MVTPYLGLLFGPVIAERGGMGGPEGSGRYSSALDQHGRPARQNKAQQDYRPL